MEFLGYLITASSFIFFRSIGLVLLLRSELYECFVWREVSRKEWVGIIGLSALNIIITRSDLFHTYPSPSILCLTIGIVWTASFLAPLPRALIAAGGLCNLIAIGLNGFLMPVLDFQLPLGNQDIRHTLLTSHSRALLLCDIIQARYEGILIATYSIGDVLLGAGIWWISILAIVRAIKKRRP